MAQTKHTVRKAGKGLLRAVKEDVTPVQPVALTSRGGVENLWHQRAGLGVEEGGSLSRKCYLGK